MKKSILNLGKALKKIDLIKINGSGGTIECTGDFVTSNYCPCPCWLDVNGSCVTDPNAFSKSCD